MWPVDLDVFWLIGASAYRISTVRSQSECEWWERHHIQKHALEHWTSVKRGGGGGRKKREGMHEKSIHEKTKQKNNNWKAGGGGWGGGGGGEKKALMQYWDFLD